MPESTVLTPDFIRQIIEQQEMPMRSRAFNPKIAGQVFRYGAMVGSNIEHHEQLDRGMNRARQLISEFEETGRSFPSGMAILADTMDNSKGRFQRSWSAPPGGLWLTLIVVNTLLAEFSRLYPVAAGTACCELLQEYDIPVHIKWVNDIMVAGKKIAGVLTESTVGHRSGEEYILIGIGINVNNDIFPKEISHIAVSMKQNLNKNIDLTLLSARMLAKLCWNIGLLHYDEARHLAANGRPETDPPESANGTTMNNFLLDSYSQLADIYNRRVIFGFDVQNNPQYEATILGLDKTGGLILKLDDGSTVVEQSGEVIYLD